MKDIIEEQEDDAKVFLNDIIETNVLETVEEFLPQEWKNMVRDKCYSWNQDKFVCEHCGHQFTSKKALTIHKKRPHKHKCDQCKCTATTRSILKTHILSNHDEEESEAE